MYSPGHSLVLLLIHRGKVRGAYGGKGPRSHGSDLLSAAGKNWPVVLCPSWHQVSSRRWEPVLVCVVVVDNTSSRECANVCVCV